LPGEERIEVCSQASPDSHRIPGRNEGRQKSLRSNGHENAARRYALIRCAL
jgi:hypothetical protein